MSFYSPTGSGNTHTDKVISGNRAAQGKNQPAKIVKKAAKKAAPKKKAK